MANYPSGISSFTTKNANDIIQAAHINALQDEVVAIETALINGPLAIGGSVTITGNLSATGAVGLVSGQRLYLDGVALSGDTYLQEASANTLRMAAGGLTMDFAAAASAPLLTLSGAASTGNVPGSGLTLSRNSSGSGAAGYLTLVARDGTPYSLWVDATGDLRISSGGPPDEDGTPSDTSGTVVGTQS